MEFFFHAQKFFMQLILEHDNNYHPTECNESWSFRRRVSLWRNVNLAVCEKERRDCRSLRESREVSVEGVVVRLCLTLPSVHGRLSIFPDCHPAHPSCLQAIQARSGGSAWCTAGWQQASGKDIVSPPVLDTRHQGWRDWPLSLLQDMCSRMRTRFILSIFFCKQC